MNDCASSIRHNPANIKAYYRSCRALFALDNVDDGIDCCNKGLAIDPQNEDLKSELQRLQQKKVVLIITIFQVFLKDMQKRRQKEAGEKIKQELAVKNALDARNIRMKNDEDRESFLHPLARSAKIILDPETGELSFPVLFLYPEFNQSDFIAEFRESDTFFEHFHAVFEETPPWDVKREYLPESIEWFFEINTLGKHSIVNVRKSIFAKNASDQSAAQKYVKLTLGDVLSSPDYLIVNGVCVFLILVRDSDFLTEFKNRYL